MCSSVVSLRTKPGTRNPELKSKHIQYNLPVCTILFFPHPHISGLLAFRLAVGGYGDVGSAVYVTKVLGGSTFSIDESDVGRSFKVSEKLLTRIVGLERKLPCVLNASLIGHTFLVSGLSVGNTLSQKLSFNREKFLIISR